MNKELDLITKELFSIDAYKLLQDPNSDEIWDHNVDIALSTINQYGWDQVFDSWKQYMIENCHSIEEALSFATWFDAFGGQTHRIDNPYEFLAYLYDIFDLNPVKYDAQIMDDVSYGILEAAGIKKHIWRDDSYTTETDPQMIKAVEELRKRNES